MFDYANAVLVGLLAKKNLGKTSVTVASHEGTITTCDKHPIIF